jgi:hypothetical protein
VEPAWPKGNVDFQISVPRLRSPDEPLVPIACYRCGAAFQVPVQPRRVNALNLSPTVVTTPAANGRRPVTTPSQFTELQIPRYAGR